MRVTLITWDGGSNRQPFETVGRALIEQGAHVEVLSHEAHRHLYESIGATFAPLPVGEKTTGSRPSIERERERVTTVWLSPEIAHATATILDETSCDVAVVDMSMLSALVSCEASGVPFVALHHSLPGAAWSGTRRIQYESFVEPLNAIRRTVGLPASAGFAEIISGARTHIVPTIAALDAPAPWALPLHYVGPLQPSLSDASVPDLPERFVLVSFSTTWQRQVDTLQAVVDALEPLDRPVVVTTGPSVDPAELTTPANAVVHRELPHAAILHRVDAVVTHAGHGTVLSALSAGVPLICVPMGRDQHDIARRVVDVGVGVRVDPADLVSDLLAAVRHVTATDRYVEAARTMASSIAAAGGIEEALALIERSVAGGPTSPALPPNWGAA